MVGIEYLHTMYNLWIFGDPSKGICPYNQISSEYDLVTYACKTNRSRTKKIVNFLVKAAIDNNIIEYIRELKDVAVSTRVFNYSYPILIKKLYAEDKLPKRPNDININTLYNRMHVCKL